MKDIASNGKVILFGEHAAVYGHTALAAGLPESLEVIKLARVPSGLRVRVPEWGVNVGSGDSCPIGLALEALERIVPGAGGCDVVIRARIPVGAGLGSSAALAVVLVGSLARARDIDMDLQATRAAAHELEKVFHGTPSGLDDAVATLGGLCLFRRGGWNGVSPPLECSRPVTGDVLAVPFPVPRWVIGNTGVPRTTSSVVAYVRERRELERESVDACFRDIEGCLHDGLTALGCGDMASLGRAMTRNHELLCGLGVSCPEIDSMIDIAADAGVLGAKMTGAGWGGCVIALSPGREDEVVQAWAAEGFQGWTVESTQ
jgi:mevalonate kinase